ncbi:hypothetical protein ACMG4P_19145 [Pseudovibrio denitrificans]|uniref:hypothetical protein n=1 Tax=Pseudovibrio denitrificans TaxID=258256 RepID=UPI0039BFC1E0
MIGFTMTIAKRWAGFAYGTNTGKLFLKLDGDDDQLTGTLHHNEPGVGVIVYDIKGKFEGSSLSFSGSPQANLALVNLGDLSAHGSLNANGNVRGDWSTTVGTAGTFELYPHAHSENHQSEPQPSGEKLHTARHQFGAISIDRAEIIEIADTIQKEFKNSNLVITISGQTEQSLYLSDFKEKHSEFKEAVVVTLRASEAETNNINKVVQVDFGPIHNGLMTQGANEAWVLGFKEKLTFAVKPYQKFYATKFNKLGVTLNQIALILTVTYVPSIDWTPGRFIFVAWVLLLLTAINYLHKKYLPFASFNFSQKPRGFFAKIWPSLLSLIIATTAAIAAALPVAYLQNLLKLIESN